MGSFSSTENNNWYNLEETSENISWIIFYSVSNNGSFHLNLPHWSFGVLGLGSGSRVHVDYIWFLLFSGPSSSALFLPLWVHFKHETLPLVSGLTRGRPSLYLFTTRSLYRPVHTWYSGSLHHFRLVKLLLRSSPLQENMIIELLALFTHQLWNMFWQLGRTFSGAEAAAGDSPGQTRSQQQEHVGTFRRGVEPKHISPW